MRSATADQLVVLDKAERSTHLRVKVDRGGGDWVDFTTLEGRDWVIRADWGTDVDAPVIDATILLRRAVGQMSLATLMDGSKLNAAGTILDAGHDVVIETATMPIDTPPSAADWVEVFRGSIDEVAWDKDPIELRCRCLGADLADAFIETQIKHPHDPATSDDVEDVMQEILDDYFGAGIVDLYSANGTAITPFNPADTPGWVINQYVQQKTHVLEALRTLAAQIGWVVKYRWHANTSSFELVFEEPDRAKVVPDYTFDGDDYFNIDRLSVSRIGVRNRVLVTYRDPTILDPVTVDSEDIASQSKYGLRTMAITVASSCQIDSTPEATVFADAVLADLKDPVLEKQVTMPYFFRAEVGDLYRFDANGVHYDSSQDLAVVSYRHSVDRKSARTTLGVRGKPSGGNKRWLILETRPGIAPQNPTYQNSAPTASADALLGGIVVSFDDPRTWSPPVEDWATAKCYVSTSSGFTPGPTNLRAQGRQTRFEIGGLTPGVTYYAKLQIVDSKGNISATSTQVSKAAGYVESMHIAKSAVGPNQSLFESCESGIGVNADFRLRAID